MSRGVVTLALCWALCAPAATALAAGFDAPASSDTSQQFGIVNPQRQDTPNDSDYDQAEPDGNPPTSTNFFDERFDLFGFASQLTRNTAIYHDSVHGHSPGQPQISGFNAAGAWKASRGRADVQIAILDTGINWDTCSLRDKIGLNAGELPLPRNAAGQENPGAGQGGYDLNGDGAVNVDDFKDDARVGAHPLCGGAITGADLIRAFSDGTDADGNGYKDDIAGWDYFADDNNPADASSYFAAENHGTGRAKEAGERANDADGALGVCPRCQIVPLRVWDTFVADANNFGLGMAYAADNGIEVIEGADGALYHSAFSEAASQYAYERGAAQVYSGDDLNTGNHNYPANYNHTMLIQGVVTDVEGLGTNDPSGFFRGLAGLCPTFCTGSNFPVSSYFRGANTTQFGGHSSVAMHGPTGSTNTGKAAGAAGLVISAAREAGVTLTPDETRIVMEQTAEDVTDANTAGAGNPDPAPVGWDEHFGWGRVDLGKAVSLARGGKVPPEASIDSPDWYAPLTGDTVKLTGRVRARFATGGQFHYKVEWGPGLGPAAGEWQTVKEGDASGALTDLGTLDLKAVRAALALRVVPQDTGGPVFSPTARNPFQDQFAVRVTVQGTGVPTAGVDRKVLTAIPDGQGLRPGFPKRLGTGGEAPLRYADLNGDNKQELIVPTEDGQVHAYEADGSELPGWPVKTRVHYSALDHAGAGVFATGGVARPLEPPRAPTIGDLDADGRPEVITAAGLNVYVWQADGALRPGFPVRSDPARCDPAQQYKENNDGGASHRKCGFLATPAVGYLEGRAKPPAIVAPSLDGHVYALRGDGTSLPGFPVNLVDPTKSATERRLAESINEAGIGDLNGDGRDDVVAATNEAYGAKSAAGDVSFGGLGLPNASGQTARVYAIDGATGHYLAGWPISISGLIQNVLPLIGPGHSPALVKVNGAVQVVTSATSGKLAEYAANGSNTRDMQQNAFGPGSNATDRSAGLNLFESAAVGDLLGTGTPAVVKYQVGLAQAANLLLVGQNTPYNHLIGAFDANTGAPLPAWPTITDDYQFLSSSTIAKVDGLPTPSNQVLAGTGLGLLHAYDGATGQDVPGFPKVTGGWLFAPAALSDDGRMAGITREGFLFEWDSSAAACQSEWPEFRHDPQGTGNYDADGTAPGAPEKLDVRALGGGKHSIAFRSPGDDRMCGTAAAYVAKVDGVAVDLGAPVAGGAQFNGQATLPAGAQLLTVQARDEVGNLGAPVSFDLVGRASGPGSGPAGTAPGATGGAGTPAGGGAGGGSTGGGSTGVCRDRSAPRTVLSRRSLRFSRARVAFSGTATDRGCGARGAGRVRRMWVGVYRAVPGACRWLQPNGRLGPRRSCRSRTLLPARGTTRWSFAKSTALPTGLYGVWALGDDTAGNREHGSSAARRAFFRLR